MPYRYQVYVDGSLANVEKFEFKLNEEAQKRFMKQYAESRMISGKSIEMYLVKQK